MQNISFNGTHRAYFYNNRDRDIMFPEGEQNSIPIEPIGIMSDGNICFKISYNDQNFFHQVSFRNILKTVLQEIVSGSNLWDYSFRIYKEYGNNIRVIYNIKGKNHPLSKFLKYASSGNYLNDLFIEEQQSDVNVNDKSFIPINGPYKQPQNVNLTLYSYQLKNLKKMLDIENNDNGFTSFLDLTVNLKHKNGIDIESLYHPLKKSLVDKPDYANLQVKGGILADEMGLGKTITMLSLIAQNMPTQQYLNGVTNRFWSRASLLICPSHLAKQWEKEANKNLPFLNIISVLTKTNHIKYSYRDFQKADLIIVSHQFLINFKYYPKVRYDGYCTASSVDLPSREIALNTVYNTIKSKIPENLNSEDSYQGESYLDTIKAPNFEHFEFYRVIIDEGHEIFGDMLSNRSQAQYLQDWINRLKYNYGWFVSGTPFVNYTGFLNCLKFIKTKIMYNSTSVSFYNTYSHILKPIIRKTYFINQIFNKICMRHLKKDVVDQISLKGYQEEVLWIKMTDVEKGIYQSHINKPRTILQQLCCHPIIADSFKSMMGNREINLDEIKEALINENNTKIVKYTLKLEKLVSTNPEYSMLKKKYSEIVNESKYMLKVLNNITQVQNGETNFDDNCSICLNEINNPSITPCGHIFCKDCIRMCLNFKKKCPMCKQSLKDKEIYLINQNNEIKKDVVNPFIEKYGSKLGKLICLCRKLVTNKDNRIIIFSQWDSMLNLIGKTLSDNDVSNTFVKGNVWCRNKSIKRFKKGDETRVIMLSLSNAASGTNLTEASHIIFVEPIDSNYKTIKAIEGQAIGRACRLGQDKIVKVYRILTRETIEEEIYKNYDPEYVNPKEIEIDEMDLDIPVEI
jgi:SNF2 family DNA or RNA helicase